MGTVRDRDGRHAVTGKHGRLSKAFAGEYNLEGKLRDDDLIYESLVREIRDITPETQS